MTRWICPPLSFSCMKITPNLCELQMECHKYSRVCSHTWKAFVHLICEPWRLYALVTVSQSTLEFAQVFFCIQIISVIKLTENMLVKAQNISTVPSKHNLNSGNLLHENNQIAVTKLKDAEVYTQATYLSICKMYKISAWSWSVGHSFSWSTSFLQSKSPWASLGKCKTFSWSW